MVVNGVTCTAFTFESVDNGLNAPAEMWFMA